MAFLSYEQPHDGPRTHVATWHHPRQGADWLRGRSEQFEKSDLFLANPVARAFFAELALAEGQTVTWSVNSAGGAHHLIVQPE